MSKAGGTVPAVLVAMLCGAPGVIARVAEGPGTIESQDSLRHTSTGLFSRAVLQRERLTGDWRGFRTDLEERGVALEFVYTGEVFGNADGGLKTAGSSEYRGNFDITGMLDTEQLGLWSGGAAFVYGQFTHGNGISEEYLGDLQGVSNIDAREFIQVSEYWYEQSLIDGRLRVRAGKQDGNADFCALDQAGDFLNGSFGPIPTVPIPTFPDPGLGAAVLADPLDWLGVSAGIFDGAPEGGRSGFDIAFDGKGGTFSMLEVAVRPLWSWNQRLPGAYRVGAWYHSGDVEEITGNPAPETFDGNHGVWVAVDQAVCEERADAEDAQGLGLFGQFGWAPDDRNEVARYVGGGLAYTGLVPGRDDDVCGVGVAHARLSDRLKGIDGRTAETTVELFYKAPVTGWLTVQPDLQYVAEPGGDGDDAVALALRFEVIL